MKNNQTTISNIVNLHQRHNNRVKGKQKKYIKKQPEIIKHVVSINNTQYNMSIEYENNKIVKEFSIGFSMKEMHINDNKQKKQLKTSLNVLGAFSVFFNFVNYRKLDLTTLEDIKSNKRS